ncbi:MAG TPA: hypothetical protein DEA08_06005 [Planctomycetes bacterium]|nr:hypothetical protein [Planctomycetota bacterium]|tara:strand:+ start:225 stop:428 length:204 start_codon:yes stop_codon:yes gene_type:complete
MSNESTRVAGKTGWSTAAWETLAAALVLAALIGVYAWLQSAAPVEAPRQPAPAAKSAQQPTSPESLR